MLIRNGARKYEPDRGWWLGNMFQKSILFVSSFFRFRAPSPEVTTFSVFKFYVPVYKNIYNMQQCNTIEVYRIFAPVMYMYPTHSNTLSQPLKTRYQNFTVYEKVLPGTVYIPVYHSETTDQSRKSISCATSGRCVWKSVLNQSPRFAWEIGLVKNSQQPRWNYNPPKLGCNSRPLETLVWTTTTRSGHLYSCFHNQINRCRRGTRVRFVWSQRTFAWVEMSSWISVETRPFQTAHHFFAPTTVAEKRHAKIF